jgi:hypothetical protein
MQVWLASHFQCQFEVVCMPWAEEAALKLQLGQRQRSFTLAIFLDKGGVLEMSQCWSSPLL